MIYTPHRARMSTKKTYNGHLRYTRTTCLKKLVPPQRSFTLGVRGEEKWPDFLVRESSSGVYSSKEYVGKRNTNQNNGAVWSKGAFYARFDAIYGGT